MSDLANMASLNLLTRYIAEPATEIAELKESWDTNKTTTKTNNIVENVVNSVQTGVYVKAAQMWMMKANNVINDELEGFESNSIDAINNNNNNSNDTSANLKDEKRSNNLNTYIHQCDMTIGIFDWSLLTNHERYEMNHENLNRNATL